MAYDDWIKIRKILPRDARVREMSKKLRTNVREILGSLVQFWCLADDHCDEFGVLVGWSKSDVEDDMRYEGFCDAMPECWLGVTDEGWVKLPDYMEHNGSTAKARAVDSKRKRDDRSRPKSVRESSDKRPSKSGLDKRRGDKSTVHPSDVPPPTPVEQFGKHLRMTEDEHAELVHLFGSAIVAQEFPEMDTWIAKSDSKNAAKYRKPEHNHYLFARSTWLPGKELRATGKPKKQTNLDRAREVLYGDETRGQSADGIPIGGIRNVPGDAGASGGLGGTAPAVLAPRAQTRS